MCGKLFSEICRKVLAVYISMAQNGKRGETVNPKAIQLSHGRTGNRAAENLRTRNKKGSVNLSF